MTRASIESGVYSRRWIAGSSPATTFGLLFVERGEQAVDQGLRGALIGHRLRPVCHPVPPPMGGAPPLPFPPLPQALFFRCAFFCSGPPPPLGPPLPHPFCPP